MKTDKLAAGLTMLLAGCVLLCRGAELHRTISLDGEWQVAEGSLTEMPQSFKHKITVPGLLDMATPPFESPGTSIIKKTAKERRELGEQGRFASRPADPLREAFWYRRNFRLDGVLPAVARLKINKACYGTKIFVNGHAAGENDMNFTPGWFDLHPFLKAGGAVNELVVRVGASLAQVPPHRTDGWDNEKSRYIPGIYDSVTLILSGTPCIVNVQTVPDIKNGSVRAVIELDRPATDRVKGVVRETVSRRIVGEAVATSSSGKKVEMVIAIRDAHLWTPENPFLYELTVDTGANTAQTRFGLRTFTTDHATGRAILNGKPYFLRGSNICIFRFFEDPLRGNLPWDREWVRTFFKRIKDMHWNSLRYAIGFPPELWYEIADEEGVLIQDEYPIWNNRAKNGWPEAITAERLAGEFTEWMREHWNHPCVAIWDAQNETRNGLATGAALMAVRDLDLSHRPWDNGWGACQKPGDFTECHPYRSNKPGFSLTKLATESGVPDNGPKKNTDGPPYILNEYGYLWINRDGSLPSLTAKLYPKLVGENATVADRFHYYARTLAAKTEFWRTKRQCAGILHFCALTYSKATGRTCDNWRDVQKLIWEPEFYRYVRASFAPVGLMIDLFDEQLLGGTKRDVPVVIINDLYEDWRGQVRLRVLQGGKAVAEQSQAATIRGLGREQVQFSICVPAIAGNYQLLAELIMPGTEPVASWRDFTVTSK